MEENLSGGAAVADPGFPRGGGANSPGGRQHTILPYFPKNCMKLKEFGPSGGACILRAPLRSATEQDDKYCISKMYKQHDAVYMAKHHRFGTKLDLQ